MLGSDSIFLHESLSIFKVNDIVTFPWHLF